MSTIQQIALALAVAGACPALARTAQAPPAVLLPGWKNRRRLPCCF